MSTDNYNHIPDTIYEVATVIDPGLEIDQFTEISHLIDKKCTLNWKFSIKTMPMQVLDIF